MDASARTGRFRLTQYFTVTSLAAFGAVAIVLYFLERGEQAFFEKVQLEQGAFFAAVQTDLLRQQQQAARTNLLVEHETGHLSLARVLANALWDRHFGPLVARAGTLPLDRCRAFTKADKPGAVARRACFAEVGARIRSFPGFAAADAAVHAMMQKSAVFKIKVYDLRGLTVYSSELPQVGEDKADNEGWISAAAGKPASELVHRDKFSAFEGEVENRDLIQTYVPVPGPDGRLVGVFEIYSDVTALLGQIEAFNARVGEIASVNRIAVESAARENQRRVVANSNKLFAIVGAMLVVLYVSLLLLVRNAQRIIDEQARAREEAARREQLAHREKMAALATMAAEATHDIGNPLAVIADLARDDNRVLEQVERIAAMTRRITEFAASRGESYEPMDINPMVQAVCDFLGFDNRYRGTHIETRLAESLPACFGVPDHLNEVLMGLLQAHAEASSTMPAAGARVLVETEARGKDVLIRIGCEGALFGERSSIAATDPRMQSARRRVEAMGGRFRATDAATEITLRCFPSQSPAEDALPSRATPA